MNAFEFKKSVLSAVVFFATLGVLSAAYAAYSAIPSVIGGQTLTASWWNAVASDLADHESRIATLAAKADDAPGAFVSISLAQCGGPCSGNHALNTWLNAWAQNYTWTAFSNTDTNTYSHNGKGTITVSKTGLYRVRLQGMLMTTADHAYWEIICPAINGSANCGYNGALGYAHQYTKAWWWYQPWREFVFSLSAGNTVAWAYQPAVALSYWGHDGYVTLEITRLK